MHTAPDSSQERLHNCCALHPDNTVVVVWRKGKKKQLLWIAPFAESDRSVYLLNFQLSRRAHSQVIISLFRGGGVCTLLPYACVHACVRMCVCVSVSPCNLTVWSFSRPMKRESMRLSQPCWAEELHAEYQLNIPKDFVLYPCQLPRALWWGEWKGPHRGSHCDTCWNKESLAAPFPAGLLAHLFNCLSPLEITVPFTPPILSFFFF